ncbi:unnamed protein product [Brugia pahangi]|uniref:TPT domain-containing protein n=1 Tax=Brugia pahangi TaxID=6280 RepID=A0A0N4TWP2_BRUPA|nr:unnamed protein product [Brugia pahangi]
MSSLLSGHSQRCCDQNRQAISVEERRSLSLELLAGTLYIAGHFISIPQNLLSIVYALTLRTKRFLKILNMTKIVTYCPGLVVGAAFLWT